MWEALACAPRAHEGCKVKRDGERGDHILKSTTSSGELDTHDVARGRVERAFSSLRKNGPAARSMCRHPEGALYWSVCVALLLLCAATPGRASGGSTPAAAVSGVVRDAHGTPQMGAMVELLAADASVVATAFTDDHGRYLIAALLPGRYSVHATAALLMPVRRADVRLQAGAQAIVNLTMNTLFEAESWLPAQKRRADEPADDWKWALRSDANRPLLRFVDPNPPGNGAENSGIQVSASAAEHTKASSQARVAVMSGDGAFGEGGVHQMLVLNRTAENGDSSILRVDMGDPASIGFPVRPSVEASAGYEKRSAMSSTRLVTSYQSHPEAAYGVGNGFQVLRLASTDQVRLGDAVLIDAGTLIQAERLAATHMVTEPFARVAVRPANGVILEYRYATGMSLQSSGDLDRLKPAADILTDATGRPLSGKGSHHEVSVSRKMGSRTVSLAAYRDSVANAGIAGSGLLAKADLQQLAIVADPTTSTFRLAAAGYTGRGLSATVVQALTPSLDLTGEYNLGTALRAQLADVATLTDTLAAMHRETMQSASVAMRGKVLRSGTAVQAEYRWQPKRTLTQVNAYNAAQDEAFLSFMLRQRLRLGHVLPAGVDAVVQATNLLEQGYTPVLAPDGHTLFLAQVPRAVMGGLAFNF